MRLNNLVELEKRMNYEFMNKSLLDQALVHSSYSNENSSYKNKHNERLEFLGDAVLELVFSELLYKNFSNNNEGYLTKVRAKLVCEQSFSNLADYFNLASYLLLGKGEEATGGREKPSIKADAFEAVCGAIYLDGGFQAVKKLIEPLFLLLSKDIKESKEVFIDYKSILQEYLHKKGKTEFKYILYKEEGLAHKKTFYMDVYLSSTLIGRGQGTNKKKAEQNAAKDALIKFGVIHE